MENSLNRKSSRQEIKKCSEDKSFKTVNYYISSSRFSNCAWITLDWNPWGNFVFSTRMSRCLSLCHRNPFELCGWHPVWSQVSMCDARWHPQPPVLLHQHDHPLPGAWHHIHVSSSLFIIKIHHFLLKWLIFVLATDVAYCPTMHCTEGMEELLAAGKD